MLSVIDTSNDDVLVSPIEKRLMVEGLEVIIIKIDSYGINDYD